MNTQLKSQVGRLLVDLESGRVLRSDDSVETTTRLIDVHPFMAQGYSVTNLRYEVFAGPDCRRAVEAVSRGTLAEELDVVRYEVVADVAGLLTLQKVVEE